MSSSDNGGGAAGAEDNLEGQIDDIRIYNQALHTMDILTIYNNTVDSTTFWTFGDEETEAAGGGEAPARKVRLLDRLNIYQGKFIIF
jgi:hypothetical protein